MKSEYLSPGPRLLNAQQSGIIKKRGSPYCKMCIYSIYAGLSELNKGSVEEDGLEDTNSIERKFNKVIYIHFLFCLGWSWSTSSRTNFLHKIDCTFLFLQYRRKDVRVALVDSNQSLLQKFDFCL